jgi:RNA 3'-terminal phosphate cyclase (ATP)
VSGACGGVITIDGSLGEGGGQVLRTSLALSLVTGKPFAIRRIRARRPKPGLMRQHLTAVLAAAEVAGAKVHGASVGSTGLTFVPSAVPQVGRISNPSYSEFTFDVGTAGSATLVLQTVLPALVLAEGPSRLCLRGGTHNTYAPPFDFLHKAFLPLLSRMGPQVDAALDCPGFYPAGGGQVTVAIEPAPHLRPIELLERGPVVRRLARAIVSRLPRHIAERELDTLRRRIDWPADCVAVEDVGSPGPGNVLIVELECRHVTEIFCGFGQRGVRAEAVAEGVAREVQQYLDADVPVGLHLADQLLIPFALARGGRFRTLAPTEHTRTNIDTLRQFLDVSVSCEEAAPGVWEVAVNR